MYCVPLDFETRKFLRSAAQQISLSFLTTFFKGISSLAEALKDFGLKFADFIIGRRSLPRHQALTYCQLSNQHRHHRHNHSSVNIFDFINI